MENLNIWGKEESDTQKVSAIFKWLISLALQVTHFWSVTISLLKSHRCCFRSEGPDNGMEGGREQMPGKGDLRMEGHTGRIRKEWEWFSGGQIFSYFKWGLKSGDLCGSDIRDLWWKNTTQTWKVSNNLVWHQRNAEVIMKNGKIYKWRLNELLMFTLAR